MFGLKGPDDLESCRLRINVILRGEPASLFFQWKRRGIVRSRADAVLQAFRAFHEKLTEMQLKTAQLRTIEEASQE